MPNLQGRADVHARMIVPRRFNTPFRLFSFAVLATIAVTWPQPWNEKSERINLVSPANGIALENQTVMLRGEVFPSTTLRTTARIQVNNDAQLVPLERASFKYQAHNLRPGLNLFWAEIDSKLSDVIGVIAPRVFHHFENEREDWALQGDRWMSVVSKPLPTEGVAGGGYLSATKSQIQLDVIFVVDKTNSMETHYEYFTDLAEKLIAQIKQVVPNTRVGIVTFRDTSDMNKDEIQDKKIIRYEKPKSTRTNLLELKREDFEGGGKRPENQHLGTVEAFKGFEEDCSPTSHKLIVVITDASPKQDEGHTDQSIGRAAAKLKIPIFSVIVHQAAASDSDDAKKNEADFEAALNSGDTLAFLSDGKCIELPINPFDKVSRTESAAERELSKYAQLQNGNLAIELANKMQGIVLERDANARAMWVAPVDCVTAMQSAAGEYLHVSLKAFESPEFILQGADQSLAVSLEAKQTRDGWSNYEVLLNESTPWKIMDSDRVISPTVFRETLSQLAAVKIRGRIASDKAENPGGLDRFIVSSARIDLNQYIPNNE